MKLDSRKAGLYFEDNVFFIMGPLANHDPVEISSRRVVVSHPLLFFSKASLQ
jgi:hypothetical protein